MTDVLPEPRPDLKPHAPRIEMLIVAKEFIGPIIGPGGKIIQGIQEKTDFYCTIIFRRFQQAKHAQVAA
jgi:polyribonucleotide nucleotidyltransferase